MKNSNTRKYTACVKQRPFITGWLRDHGIAYLDMAVKALDEALAASGGADFKPKDIIREDVCQYDLAQELGFVRDLGAPLELKCISKIFCLLPKQGAERSRIKELLGEEKWAEVLASVERTKPPVSGWRKKFILLLNKMKRTGVFPDKIWFEENWGSWGSDSSRLLWQVINEAPVAFQVDWYKEHSALYRLGIVEFPVVFKDADETKIPEITRDLQTWLNDNRDKVSGAFVNLWGTSTAVQFAWYYWAWQDIGLKDATYLFLKTRWRAENPQPRFRPIEIRVAEKEIIANQISRPAIQSWESPNRAEVKTWLNSYLKWGDNFCILLLGKRGSGKSHSIRMISKEFSGKEVVEANCANFPDPIHARSELFGHVKGAFTGADKRDGLLTKADGKILFLDEIHHLDPQSRHLLLTALQTDPDGNFSFAPLGSDKIIRAKFQLIVGSNLPLSELKGKLEADFFDRVSQRILEMPSLDASEIKGVWPQIWEGMKFIREGTDLSDPSHEQGFLQWVQTQPLHGNFRDLERIAIAVADYRGAITDKNKFIKPSLLEHLRHEARRWSAADSKEERKQAGITIDVDLADKDSTDKTFLRKCRKTFADKMTKLYGNQSKAVDALKERGSKMTKPLFSKWMNPSEP